MPTVLAPAKVNLCLHVLDREASGYHQIETLFCLVGLSDQLIVEPGPDGIQLEIDGSVPGEPDDNLVCRAARLYYRTIGSRPALRILLRKRIPVGAGLGGGSSDAAAVLRALNALHGSILSREALIDMGGSIGSDVPFLVSGAALALARGRGERLLELDPLPVAPMVIASPPEPMPTADAYAALAASRSGRASSHSRRLLTADDGSAWDRIARVAENDFDEVVAERIPAVRTLRETLGRAGARIALLSGSGSSVFGVFDDVATRTAAAAAARSAVPGCRVFETHSALATGR